jgi:hypothetical protein
MQDYAGFGSPFRILAVCLLCEALPQNALVEMFGILLIVDVLCLVYASCNVQNLIDLFRNFGIIAFQGISCVYL